MNQVNCQMVGNDTNLKRKYSKERNNIPMYTLSNYEKQYITALRNIYEHGFSDGVNERTQKETKRLPGIVFQINVKDEFPILKSKQTIKRRFSCNFGRCLWYF